MIPIKLISRVEDGIKQRKMFFLLCLLLVAVPWIVLFILTHLVCQNSVTNLIPCWSDELGYWHEVLSFSQKGFHSGYYTFNELTPKWLSFGTHGFGTVSLYSVFATVFGWKFYSIPVANSFFISIAFLFLVVYNRPSVKKLLLLAAFYLTFTPIVLYTTTSMSELLNYSLLIVYFSMLYSYSQNKLRKLLIILLLYCIVISFVRVINVVLFLPVILYSQDKLNRKLLYSILLWLLTSTVIFFVTNLFVSPYPYSYLNDLFSSKGFPDFVRNFVTHFGQNAINFVHPFSDDSIQVVQRYFIFSVLIYSIARILYLKLKKQGLDRSYFIVSIVLSGFLVLNVAAYDIFDWRDYRIMAPVLFGCVLFYILKGNFEVVYASLLANVIILVVLCVSPEVYSQLFNNERYAKVNNNQVLQWVKYTDNASSHFQNTMVVSDFNKEVILNIPAGVGVTYAETLTDTLSSEFIYSNKKVTLRKYRIVGLSNSGIVYQRVKSDNKQ